MKKIITVTLLAYTYFKRVQAGQQNQYGIHYQKYQNYYQPQYNNNNKQTYRKTNNVLDSINERFEKLFEKKQTYERFVLDNRQAEQLSFRQDGRFQHRLFGRGVHEKPVQIIPIQQNRVNRFKEVSLQDNDKIVGRGFGHLKKGQIPKYKQNLNFNKQRHERESRNSLSSNLPRIANSVSAQRQSIVRNNLNKINSKAKKRVQRNRSLPNKRNNNEIEYKRKSGIFSNRYKKIARRNNSSYNANRQRNESDASRQSYVTVNYRMQNPSRNAYKEAEQKSYYYKY